MRKGLTCSEVLEMIMQPDPSSELQDVSSSPSDTTDSGESDPDLDVAPSSSSLASTEGEEDSEDPGSGWIGRNGEVWFSTNAETTPFLQPARGVTPGPTRYAFARVQNMDSVFNLFFTEEMIDLIVSMTCVNTYMFVQSYKHV